MAKPSLFRTAIAAMAAGAVLAVPAITPAYGAPPGDGLIAEYLFDQAAGAEVANTAAESSFGPATVRNLQNTDWTGTSLTLRGGAKTSTGNWVELPDDLLAGAESATVVTEVKVTTATLSGFHFLWNIGNESAATEYFFSSLNCGSGRSPLVGVKSQGVERLVSSGSCGVTADQWVSVASVVDGAAGDAALYLDGREVARSGIDVTPADVGDQSLNTIGRAPWPDPLVQGALSAFRVYDRALSGEEIDAIAIADAEINAAELRALAQSLLDGLELTDFETSTEIDLATAGGRIAWSSSDPAVIAEDGAVQAPLLGEQPVEVSLTATATVRGVTASTTITVTVLPSSETPEQRAERLAGLFVVPPVLESGSSLPPAPAGTSVTIDSVSGAQVSGGVITTDSAESVDAVIEARVTDAATGASATRVSAVRVLPAGRATQLLAYHRVPTSAQEANNADVALSMHLALEEAEGWTPLNENYGIFFARTAVVPPASGTSSQLIRSLRDPHVFHLPGEGYGIVATRTARGGASDGSQVSQLLFARSTDLLSYEEVGLVDLGVSSGVNEPAAIWDSASERYIVTWTSDAGVALRTSFAELTDPASRSAVQRGVVAATGGSDGPGIPDFATGNRIAVEQSVADALRVRFGRIANTAVRPFDDVELSVDEVLDAGSLPGRAELEYDDGSTATRAIEWDAESIAGVDTSTPGAYEVTGTIRQERYPTPFADERADPSIFRWDWNGEPRFLMIATEDLNLNPVDPANGPHMPFRIAEQIGDLSDEAIADGRNTEVDLLVAGDTDSYGDVMTGCFWAPELHVIAGRLSILFMPCYDGASGNPDIFTGRASIIQLRQDADGRDLDPAVAANWTRAERVVRADGSILNPIQGISLDMTYFEDAGQSYYAWQMLGAVFIARMDPADPTRLASAPVRIIVPEYAWDNTIAEGPNVHAEDGRLYMIYSGSTVGDTYTTGLVIAESGADLTAPEAWVKLNHPVQKSGVFEGEWQLGPGHGMWSSDEDDNLLYVFHARTDNLGLSGRDTFVRRVHFAADGIPVFDMETDEEVAPDNRTVSLTVNVVGDVPSPVAVSSVVASRCVVGRVTQTVTVTNDGDAPVSISVESPYGSRAFESLAPGRSGSAAFSTRRSAILGGTVTVRAAAIGADEGVEDTIRFRSTVCS